MRWDPNHQSPDVEDRRGQPSPGGGGRGFPIGAALALGSRFGWKGILVVLVLLGLAYFGSGLLGGHEPTAPAAGVQSVTPTQDPLAHFVGFVLDDVQATWHAELPHYADARLILFDGATPTTGCGTASASVGPFYCPSDHQVYIDLAFYGELRRRFGAPGDFAQAYVVAHEVGHHVQSQYGLLGDGGNSIATELQADCLAGAWAQSAGRRGIVEVGDIDEALTAAAAIGDDTIQRRTSGTVRPETWTHGSAAQRSSAFTRGLQGGPVACGISARAKSSL
jgi:predicted metalloprotease